MLELGFRCPDVHQLDPADGFPQLCGSRALLWLFKTLGKFRDVKYPLLLLKEAFQKSLKKCSNFSNSEGLGNGIQTFGPLCTFMFVNMTVKH